MSLTEIVIIGLSALSAVGAAVFVVKCVSIMLANNAKMKSHYATLALQERLAKQQDEEVAHLLARASTMKANLAQELSEISPLKEKMQDKQLLSSHVVINLATATKLSAQPEPPRCDLQTIALKDALLNLPMATPTDAVLLRGEQQEIRQKADQALEEQITSINQGLELRHEQNRIGMNS